MDAMPILLGKEMLWFLIELIIIWKMTYFKYNLGCYTLNCCSCFNILLFQQPFHCEIEHKLGMTCVTTGPVTCRVRLDRGGYVPGEAINIWATIDNQSKVTIKGTRSCLTEVSVCGECRAAQT